MLMIVSGDVDAWLLDCATLATRESIETIDVNCISCFVDHF